MTLPERDGPHRRRGAVLLGHQPRESFHDYPVGPEQIFGMDRRVPYEALYRNSVAARARILDAAQKKNAAVSRLWSPDGFALAMLVWLCPEQAEEFRVATKAVELKYRSPCRFDNGSLIPIFKDPEAELADRRRKWEARQVLNALTPES